MSCTVGPHTYILMWLGSEGRNGSFFCVRVL
jgi:hypothetical protein